MIVAANGWWLWTILAIVIWIAIAFWPARVASRKGRSFLGYFIFQLVLLPGGPDRRLCGLRQDGSCDRVRPAAKSRTASNAARGIKGPGYRDDIDQMRRLIGRENGQTMAEYAVVLALLTITTAAVFTALSGGVANAMTSVTGVV